MYKNFKNLSNKLYINNNMGVNNCNKFLNNIGKKVYFKELKGKKIAIDILIYIFKFYHSNEKDLKKTEKGLLDFLNNLHDLNITPICVFDGKNKPKEKAECIKKRKIYVFPNDLCNFFCGEYISIVDYFNLDINNDIIKNIEHVYDIIKEKYFNIEKKVDIKSDTIKSDTIKSDTIKSVDNSNQIKEKNPVFQIPEKNNYIQYVLYKSREYTKLVELFPDIPIQQYVKNLYKPPSIKNLTYQDILNLKKKIASKFTVYDADGEGESLCCYLLDTKQVDYVMSEDSDVFVYGSKKTLRSVKKDYCTLICMEDILTNLKLDEDKFKCLCIMMGTDYKQCGLKSYGFLRCLEILRKEDGMKMLIEKYDSENETKYKDILNLFSTNSKFSLYVDNKNT